MSLLFERTDEDEEPWISLSADLSNAYFCGLELKNAQFQKANLQGAWFHRADLEGARFQGANLKDAKFREAYLLHAQFHRVHLLYVQFQGAHLVNAEFQVACVEESKFQGANLRGAQFQWATLADSEFQAADLGGAQFQETDIWSEFQGSFSDRPMGPLRRRKFGEHIRGQVGKKAELSKVVSSGGMRQADLDKMIIALSNPQYPQRVGRAKASPDELREAMAKHVDKPSNYGPPDDAGTGSYTQEDAEKWIKEHKEALESLPSEIGPLKSLSK